MVIVFRFLFFFKEEKGNHLHHVFLVSFLPFSAQSEKSDKLGCHRIRTDTRQFLPFHWLDDLWQTNHSLHLICFLRVCRYFLIKFLVECIPPIASESHCSDTKWMKQLNLPVILSLSYSVLSFCGIRDCVSNQCFKAPMTCTLLHTKLILVVKISRLNVIPLQHIHTHHACFRVSFTAVAEGGGEGGGAAFIIERGASVIDGRVNRDGPHAGGVSVAVTVVIATTISGGPHIDAAFATSALLDTQSGTITTSTHTRNSSIRSSCLSLIFLFKSHWDLFHLSYKLYSHNHKKFNRDIREAFQDLLKTTSSPLSVDDSGTVFKILVWTCNFDAFRWMQEHSFL